MLSNPIPNCQHQLQAKRLNRPKKSKCSRRPGNPLLFRLVKVSPGPYIRSVQQESLFNEPLQKAAGLPDGLLLAEEFVTVYEEQSLLQIFQSLPLTEARYQQYTARRRTVNYGSGYDFSHRRTTEAPPIPEFLQSLRIKAARWAQVAPDDFAQALISEYTPGTPLGWHRDVPDYELIFGLTLGGRGRLRFRPYPWRADRRQDIFEIRPEPRSAYILRDAVRWQWQHSVPPAKVLRYSVTLRTQRRQNRE